jgi:uncharacterized membrane protein YkvA (DUF1232 family)
MMDPAALKKWLIVVGVLYLVFPRDLIPDFLGGGLGFIEDVLLIALLVYFYRKHVRDHAARAGAGSEQPGEGERSSRTQAAAPEGAPGPYEILGIAPSASGEEIQAAYRARMSEYHPDKVAHLGEELQQLAHRKALEIQRAYRELRR